MSFFKTKGEIIGGVNCGGGHRGSKLSITPHPPHPLFYFSQKVFNGLTNRKLNTSGRLEKWTSHGDFLCLLEWLPTCWYILHISPVSSEIKRLAKQNSHYYLHDFLINNLYCSIEHATNPPVIAANGSILRFQRPVSEQEQNSKILEQNCWQNKNKIHRQTKSMTYLTTCCLSLPPHYQCSAGKQATTNQSAEDLSLVLFVAISRSSKQQDVGFHGRNRYTARRSLLSDIFWQET